MADLIERQIAALAPHGDVLVCGSALLPAAGVDCIEARRVILMEPDPVRRLDLTRPLRDAPAVVEVLEAMAGKAPVNARLNRYNFRPASSLRPPTGVKDLFPGLHLRDQVEVRIRDAAEIAKRIRSEPGYRNTLIVGTPGEEAEILSRLNETELLGIFDHILLPLPDVPLYQGSASASDLMDLLLGAGYILMARDDIDADVPQGHFFRHGELHAGLADLRFEFETKRKQLSEVELALKEARDTVNAGWEDLRMRNKAEVSRRILGEANRVAAQSRIVRTFLSPRAGS